MILLAFTVGLASAAPSFQAPSAARLPTAAPPPTAPADDGACGTATAMLPDFTLADVNPWSSSYGEKVSRADLAGQVLVAYFAQAT